MCQKWSGMSEIPRTNQSVHECIIIQYKALSVFFLDFFITIYIQITWTEISLCWNGGTIFHFNNFMEMSPQLEGKKAVTTILES